MCGEGGDSEFKSRQRTPVAGNRDWARTSGSSRLPRLAASRSCPSEFPDNQNIDSPPHQSIFATTKCQQNLEILKFALMWFDVFDWKKIFDLSMSDLFI